MKFAVIVFALMASNRKPPSDANDLAGAVRAAEQFIARNGYTEAAPDRSSLSHESLERASNVDELLAQRHDTLESHAWGFFEQKRASARGRWVICFRYKKISNGEAGRGVTFTSDGSPMRVEHQDVRLKACHPIPKPK